MTPGDWASWLQDLLTLAAAIGAFQLYRVESARDRRNDEDRRQDQASKFAVWVDQLAGPRLLMVNNSHLPVYNVRGTWGVRHAAKNRQRTFYAGQVGPTNGAVAVPDTSSFQQAATDAAETSKIPIIDLDYYVTVEFSDTAGTRWWRDSDGVLKEVA